jgi:neurotransmitter:Na+ symporter, NSS family
MAGNAVGLGNFLRFPRQAAVNGGGSFMIPYFIALLLLGIPLMWIEWGVGRNGGRFRKGHIPGMFAALWHHPAAKYLGIVGMVIPLSVMIYYTYIESWTLAFSYFSITKDYWGNTSQEQMVTYLQSFQGINDAGFHAAWFPYFFFILTLGINIWVLSHGISGGIEKLARIGIEEIDVDDGEVLVRVCLGGRRRGITEEEADRHDEVALLLDQGLDVGLEVVRALGL